MMVFVSFGLRLRINIEALNMVESFGNYVRHRNAPVIRRSDRTGYEVVFAPTISGQSIANGYMRAMVDLILSRNNESQALPLCDDCKNAKTIGGFMKRSSDQNLSVDNRVSTCVVDDVTGFMAAQKNVSSVTRRTSKIMFSYAVPDADSAKPGLMPQFHVRFSSKQDENAPFQVEGGSAIYMLGIAIDVDNIGKLSDNSYVKDRKKRVEVTFDALMATFGGIYFGAKKARYLPIIDVLGGVASVSHPIPFMVSAPRYYNYVNDTVSRARVYVCDSGIKNESIQVFYFDNEGVVNESELKDEKEGDNESKSKDEKEGDNESKSKDECNKLRLVRVNSLEELILSVKKAVLKCESSLGR